MKSRKLAIASFFLATVPMAANAQQCTVQKMVGKWRCNGIGACTPGKDISELKKLGKGYRWYDGAGNVAIPQVTGGTITLTFDGGTQLRGTLQNECQTIRWTPQHYDTKEP